MRWIHENKTNWKEKYLIGSICTQQMLPKDLTDETTTFYDRNQFNSYQNTSEIYHSFVIKKQLILATNFASTAENQTKIAMNFLVVLSIHVLENK